MKYNSKESDGLSLPVVEEFYSVQGEGWNTGRAAYFIRIGGCDLCCSWCDTKYAWDAELHPPVSVSEIAGRVLEAGADSAFVTGGEPLMWNLDPLCGLIRSYGIKTYLETSGAHPLTGSWDWITLSPKRESLPLPEIWPLANELKVVVTDGTDFERAEQYSTRVSPECVLMLQPEWSRYKGMIAAITDYVKKNSRWMVSIQAHKFMNIP